jgi:hypothetical protein
MTMSTKKALTFHLPVATTIRITAKSRRINEADPETILPPVAAVDDAGWGRPAAAGADTLSPECKNAGTPLKYARYIATGTALSTGKVDKIVRCR